MKSRRTWWMIYAACIIAGFAMLIWISSIMLRLENLNRLGEVAQVHQESLRLALWRMDSWLGPRLAREAARPYFVYASFYPQEGAYRQLLNSVEADEILTPSPLLNFSSDIFTLHFQRTSAGGLSSPQVPQGDMLEAARLLTQLEPDRLNAKRELLGQIEPLVAGEQFAITYTDAEQMYLEELNDSTTVVLSESAIPNQQPAYQDPTKQLMNSSLSRSNMERGRRSMTGSRIQQEFIAQQTQSTSQRILTERDGLDVGVFVPLWMTEPDDRRRTYCSLSDACSGNRMICFRGYWWTGRRWKTCFLRRLRICSPRLDSCRCRRGRCLLNCPPARSPVCRCPWNWMSIC